MIKDPQQIRNEFITQDCHLSRLLDDVELIAKSESTVLIEGETGTGKEVLARLIHSHSPRRSDAFVVLNCGINSGALWSSEVFGHSKGAFTGASSQRDGLVLAAQGGTLFIDEVARLSLEAQASLLRFMETGEVRRIGSTQTEYADVRILVASNTPLADLVDEGGFLPDLYYRMNVNCLWIPPLRERPDDIGALIRHFLIQGQTEESVIRNLAESSVMDLLLAYPWYGNAREVRSFCSRLILKLAQGPSLDAAALQALLGRKYEAAMRHVLRSRGRMSHAHDASRFILAALRFRGDIEEVSACLGIPRSSAYRYLADLRDCGVLGS